MQLNLNGVNRIPKGTLIYAQDKEADSFSIILKGTVLVYNSGIKLLLREGDLIGTSDLCMGYYHMNVYAMEDTALFTIGAKSVEELEAILEEKPKQRGTVLLGMLRYLDEVYKIEQALRKEADLLYGIAKKAEKELGKLKSQMGEKKDKVSALEEIGEVPAADPAEEAEKMYYIETISIPIYIQEEFYSYSAYVCNYHVRELAMLAKDTTEFCMDLSEYCIKLAEILFSEKDENCLYKQTVRLGISAAKTGISTQPFLSLLDMIAEKLKETESAIQAKTGTKATGKQAAMQQVKAVLSKAEHASEGEISVESAVKYAAADKNKMAKDLSHSFEKLLRYADYDTEKAEDFKGMMEAFLMMKDKGDTSDGARKIRRNLTEHFYTVYELIFRKAYKSKSVPKVVDLFLNFGYMDERLLEKEQLLELYHLDTSFPEKKPCPVYTIREWLCRIYEGKEEPSKSEFDLEYGEALREKKKSGEITDAELKKMEIDQEAKLSYEIRNMFRYNNRLVSGQVSSFVPILYRDLFIGHMESALVTAQKINQWISEIIRIDYSAFYREMLYENREKKIERESIMVEVFPNMILLPTYGSNIVMWQEIAGKKRKERGRILLPVFAESDLNDDMIKAVARFRWELCRTVQGMAWNDITEKSLTSEYCDYIQFYKKNRSLSEDKKEKLKVQIQKGKGNTREVFALDYLAWVKGESQGSVRLNKVAREMLATWCPFAREIREKLVQQPIFEEAFFRYNRDKMKKVKELESRYRMIENNRGEIVEELQTTIRYYKEL